MANYNEEISTQITLEGGTIVYSSGNILVASEISQELYIELLKSPYIDTLEVLPLKRYGDTKTIDIPTHNIQGTTKPFDDITTGSNDDEDEENQSGGGSDPSASSSNA